MRDIDLRGKVVIVTGAAQGLGKAIAQGLARAGANVALCDVSEEQLDVVAVDLGNECGSDRIFAAATDVSNEKSTRQFVDSVASRFGQIDALINNAALGCASVRPDFMSSPIPIWKMDPAEWRRVIEVNTNGTFLLTRWATPHMVRRGAGRIINVTTTFQTMLAPKFGAYGPSKAAVEAMSSILVEELEDTGVTVNIVVPGGPADTAQVPDSLIEDRSKLLRPDVMIAPILWLCSDASAETTGLRFSGALWDESLSSQQSIEKSCKPIAWRQLVEPLVTAAGVDVQTSRTQQ
jgi:NAD(P)-dependent dehydrogenase (short-subunit alcohol dehydrogenase family)